MSFKTLNISMAKILKRDRYNILFDALSNKLQYVLLQSLRTLARGRRARGDANS